MYGLDIGQADTHILSGAHRVNGDIKRLVAVLLGQRGFPASLLFLLVNFTGLLFLKHFTCHRQAVDPVGEFTDGGLFRNRKGIDRFESVPCGFANTCSTVVIA